MDIIQYNHKLTELLEDKKAYEQITQPNYW